MSGADPFEAFVRRYQDMVYATAVRLLGRPADAEDIAQTVFLRAFQRFDALKESPSAAGWLKTVTTNACLNHLSRYRSRWRLFSELSSVPSDSAAGDSLPFEDRIEDPSLPDRAFEEAAEREGLEDALRALPDHQRVPLVLFHFEEMSYQDIAATLRVSLGKVKTDIHRGREALRRALSGGRDVR